MKRVKKIKVLVVDDSVIITQRISEMVYEVPCVSQVIIAKNYQLATQLLQVHKPHFVLLDIELPNQSGIELLEFIKANYPTVLVIMVSNKASIYYRDICQKMGAHAFIDKSKEFENIPEIIKEYCL